MARHLMKLCYDGSAYHGWQVQQNAVTVQPTVQDALEAVLHFRPNVTGCSRTDSGVHANAYYFHFDYDGKIPPAALVRAVNTKLPRDIAALGCCAVPMDFHARYSVLSKQYIYRFYNAPIRSPFYEHRAYFEQRPLDEQLMNEAAQGFIGCYDYCGFCSAGSSVEDTVRSVIDASVTRSGELVEFSVTADGFLYNMVRIMAGTLLSVAEGKIAAADIPNIIRSGEREHAGRTLAPEGLYLNSVAYKGIVL